MSSAQILCGFVGDNVEPVLDTSVSRDDSTPRRMQKQDNLEYDLDKRCTLEEDSEGLCEHVAEDHPLRWLTPTPPQSPRQIVDTQMLMTHLPIYASEQTSENAGFVQERSMLSPVAFSAITGRGRFRKAKPPPAIWSDSSSSTAWGSGESAAVSEDSDDSYSRHNHCSISRSACTPPTTVIGQTFSAGMSTPASMVGLTGTILVPQLMSILPICASMPPMAAPALAPVLQIAASPPSASMPAFGNCHRFHTEINTFGSLSSDAREFTKRTYQHQLSVVTEDEIRYGGVHSYVLQFTGGELSSADGVGFIFSKELPCPKNIQRIVSIFVNRAGKICVRAKSEVVRSATCVGQLNIGDWVGISMDLDEQVAHFTVWPADGRPPSHANIAYGDIMASLQQQLQMRIPTCGYVASVVKLCGVSLKLVS